MSFTLDCPACAKANALSTGANIVTCRHCQHRWMPLTEGQISKVVSSVYTEQYRGYVADSHQDATFRAILDDEFRSRKAPPAHVLDVGCGNGAFLAAAKAMGYNCQGIDVSEASGQRINLLGAGSQRHRRQLPNAPLRAAVRLRLHLGRARAFAAAAAVRGARAFAAVAWRLLRRQGAGIRRSIGVGGISRPSRSCSAASVVRAKS